MVRVGFDGAANLFRLFVPQVVYPAVNARMQAARIACFQTCVINTPVRSGRLRNGWQMQDGQIDTSRLRNDAGQFVTRGSGGNLVVPNVRRAPSLRGTIETLFLINGVEYAEYVNDGTDRFMGRFMLQKGLAAAVVAFNNFRDPL